MKPKHPLLSRYNNMELDFNGDNWTIKMVSDLGHKKLQDGYISQYEGEMDWLNSTIRIRKGLGRAETHQRFWHEVIHAIEGYYRFELKHEHVDKVAQGLADLFALNRKTLGTFFK
jgi:hypothetical protein